MASGRFSRVAAAGAVGGGINATLCYLRLPVPVRESAATFEWHVIPAGVVHGCILAACGAFLGLAARSRPWGWRVVAGLVGGWLAGYVSWIPLGLSVFKEPLLKTLVWPLAHGASAAWDPFLYFGGVTALLCLGTAFSSGDGPEGLVLIGAIAGALGSLFWWVSWGPWYFSILHGLVWGMPTGWAMWRTRRGDA